MNIAAKERMVEMARRLSERFGVTVEVMESENGDADWMYPVHALVTDDDDAYALCDLFAGTLEAQTAFMAEQLEDSSLAIRLRRPEPLEDAPSGADSFAEAMEDES